MDDGTDAVCAGNIRCIRMGSNYYSAYPDKESEECFQIGGSDVCRAKMQVVTPSGDFVMAIVAPDSMSSVSLAEGKMLHFCTADEEPKFVKRVYGIESLEKSGFLISPHPTTLIPAYAASKEMIPKHIRILLSKSALDALAIGFLFWCTQTAAENVPDVKCSCRKPGGVMTHVVSSHVGETTECRILARVPPPPCNLGSLACIEFGNPTAAYLRPTLLKETSETGWGQSQECPDPSRCASFDQRAGAQGNKGAQ